MDAMGDARAALRALAEHEGVQLSYEDVEGQTRHASDEVLVAVLQALGVPLERVADAPAALRARRLAHAEQVVPPVVVAWHGKHPTIRLRLPADDQPEAVSGRLEPASPVRGPAGGPAAPAQTNQADPRWAPHQWALAAREPARRRSVEGQTYLEHDLTLAPSARLPLGMHRLRLEVGDACHDVTVIAAPRQAYGADAGGRRWGLFAPLYALRSAAGWGAGDLSDLAALAEWATDKGASTLATLPLLAAFLDEPFEPSPYMPVSRLFWNELYVDPRAQPELAVAPEARHRLADRDLARELAVLRARPEVDYRRLMALKRPVLAALAEAFFARGDPARRAAFDAFVAARPTLDRYAAFRAVGERQRAPWHEWPARLRDGAVGPDDYDAVAWRYHRYVQWAADEQIARAADALTADGDERVGAGLYLDLPLGVHPSSFDTWHERALFASGVEVGAPPDTFFTAGQRWGFPPLHPARQRAEGYRYLAAALRHHMAHAGVLRIDHVMALHRLYCIPSGLPASEGAYVRYPAEELYAVLALAAAQHQTLVVGENLGTVPPEVDRGLARHGVRGMYVLQYELEPGRGDSAALPPVPEDAVASLNTHDMPTFRGFWEGRDIARRHTLGLLDDEGAAEERAARAELRGALLRALRAAGHLTDAPRADRPSAGAAPEPSRGAAPVASPGTVPWSDVLGAALEHLAASSAGLVLVALEDLWGERDPQNVPGTTDEHPNWRRRAARSIEALAADPALTAPLRRVDRARRRAAMSDEGRPAARREPVSERERTETER